eukprot:12751607-Ditylum_brightwellii.AAC.1
MPVIPNHRRPPKGESGCPRKRQYEKNAVLECKKILQNQARDEKKAMLAGDAAPPAIDSFHVSTCSSCDGTMHNKQQCRMAHDGF